MATSGAFSCDEGNFVQGRQAGPYRMAQNIATIISSMLGLLIACNGSNRENKVTRFVKYYSIIEKCVFNLSCRECCCQIKNLLRQRMCCCRKFCFYYHWVFHSSTTNGSLMKTQPISAVYWLMLNTTHFHNHLKYNPPGTYEACFVHYLHMCKEPI